MSEYANKTYGSKKDSKTVATNQQKETALGMYLEDNRPESVVQAKLKEGINNTNVVQAIGWETLGPLNPRRYLPEKWYGYTQEQMEENGLAAAPPQAAMPAPAAPMPAPPAAMPAPPLEESSEEAVAPAKLSKGQKKRLRQKRKANAAPPPSASAAAAYDGGGGGPSRLSNSDSEGEWETVDTAGKKRAQRQRTAQNRQQRAQFRASFSGVLRKWVDKADQDGTMNMYGTGSAAEHDLEARAKQRLRDVDPRGAIELLQEAIAFRQAGLGSSGSPGYQGHADAIAYLERLIRAIEKL